MSDIARDYEEQVQKMIEEAVADARKRVIDAEDAVIRARLIARGWTPPRMGGIYFTLDELAALDGVLQHVNVEGPEHHVRGLVDGRTKIGHALHERRIELARSRRES